jgi:hypothetical protein
MPESRTLVVYGASARGDALLREAARKARRSGERLTVMALAYQEPVRVRCCNFQSAYWNEVQRGMAESELVKARLAVDDDPSVEFAVLGYEGARAADAVAGQAEHLGAQRIVLADPRAAGLGRRALRRLRLRSPVPVS